MRAIKVGLILAGVTTLVSLAVIFIAMLLVSLGAGEPVVSFPPDSPLARIPWGVMAGLGGASVALFALSRIMHFTFRVPSCPVGCLLVMVLLGGGFAAAFIGLGGIALTSAFPESPYGGLFYLMGTIIMLMVFFTLFEKS